jgi:hypothetical protein
MSRSTANRTAGALAFVLAAALLVSASAGPLKGKVKKGVYYAPAGNFSLREPKDLPGWSGEVGMHTSEGYAPDSTMGVVSFADDFGKVLGIGYLRAHERSLPLLADTTQTYALLEEWIRLFALPKFFQTVHPDSRLVRVQPARLAGAPAALALVNVPQGSTMSVVSAGQTRLLDSRRGLLVFVREGYVYMLFNETLAEREALADSTAVLELDLDTRVLAQLRPFYETIRFEAGGAAGK